MVRFHALIEDSSSETRRFERSATEKNNAYHFSRRIDLFVRQLRVRYAVWARVHRRQASRQEPASTCPRGRRRHQIHEFTPGLRSNL